MVTSQLIEWGFLNKLFLFIHLLTGWYVLNENYTISAMFVDIGDNHSVVDRVKFCYVYDDIDLKEVRLTYIRFS